MKQRKTKQGRKGVRKRITQRRERSEKGEEGEENGRGGRGEGEGGKE